MCLGIPGQIVGIVDAAKPSALVDVGGVRREVNIACVAEAGEPVEACVGEWVLVHVGFAMARIDAAEAEQTLAILSEIGELQAETGAMRHSGER